MAIDTLRDRALERRTRMATLASYIEMSTIQWKAGTKVIERFLRYRRRIRKHRISYNGRPQYQATDHFLSAVRRTIPQVHCSILMSLNESAEWQRSQLAPNSPSCTSSLRWQSPHRTDSLIMLSID